VKTCSCGHVFDPKKATQLGTLEGLKYFNCPSCSSTICEPADAVVIKNKNICIKATIKELEDYIESEKKRSS
jgi:hypothetical protein